MPPSKPDDFFAKGPKLAETRKAAFDSYSKATDVVRVRLMELEQENLHGKRVAARMDQLERALAVAKELRELTVLEYQNADALWREWLDEARALREDERLLRQQKVAASSAVAAWGSFLAAIASVIVTWSVSSRPANRAEASATQPPAAAPAALSPARPEASPEMSPGMSPTVSRPKK